MLSTSNVISKHPSGMTNFAMLSTKSWVFVYIRRVLHCRWFKNAVDELLQSDTMGLPGGILSGKVQLLNAL